MMRKAAMGDLDSWYREHMHKRNSVPEAMLRHRLDAHRRLQETLSEQDDPSQGGPDEVTSTQVIHPAVASVANLSMPRKSLQENGSLLKSSPLHVQEGPRRKSFDVGADSDRRPSVIGSLIHRINLPAMKKSDQKSSGLNKTWSKSSANRASPQMGKKNLGLMAQDSTTSQGSDSSRVGIGGSSGVNAPGTSAQLLLGPPDDASAPNAGASSEDLTGNLLDNGSDTGTDEVDSGESSNRTKQAIRVLQAKILKTKEAIRKEQNNKESIVNEYLQMASDKQPTTRIKTLFEKKNQKSAQNILHLQRKLEAYQMRLTEVEQHGYTGHKQAKEVLRDVGQGLKDVMEGVKGATDTIVSKPKEFAHLIKNKFGSADNISQLSKFYVELEDGVVEGDGKTGGTLPASFKYASDDENSSITSGSGLGGLHGSPQSTQNSNQINAVTAAMLAPLSEDLGGVREMSRKTKEGLMRHAEDFEEYKNKMQNEVSLLRSLLEDEKFRVERLEEQLNDLTELHQHEMHNLKQDLASTEEKIEYRLDERTTDLSDLVDNASTRISRLEQQQQQQQILSMEMVENATFRTIISKLINVVLALLAVVLVFVSTAASFLSPFINSRSRLAISIVISLIAWLLYHNYSYIQDAASYVGSVFSWSSS